MKGVKGVVEKVVYALYSTLFLALALLGKPPDSFVLLTVSVIFAFAVKRGKVYALAASILGVTFAVLSAMSIAATAVSAIITHQQFLICLKSQPGVAGFVCVPLAKLIYSHR